MQHNKPSNEKMFNYLKKLDKDCSFEVFNNYMDKLVNEILIDVQDHVEQESLFIINKLTNFLNIFLVSIDLVDKLTQAEIDHNNNERAIDSSRTLSDPKNFSDNNNVSQFIRKTTDDTLALYG